MSPADGPSRPDPGAMRTVSSLPLAGTAGWSPEPVSQRQLQYSGQPGSVDSALPAAGVSQLPEQQ